MLFEFPARVPVADARYQQLVARAKANPDDFARACRRGRPARLLLPADLRGVPGNCSTAVRATTWITWCLSLYYHAFVFVVFTLFFLVSRTDPASGFREGRRRLRASRVAAGVSAARTASRVWRIELADVLQARGAGRTVSRDLLRDRHPARHVHWPVDVLSAGAQRKRRARSFNAENAEERRNAGPRVAPLRRQRTGETWRSQASRNTHDACVAARSFAAARSAATRGVRWPSLRPCSPASPRGRSSPRPLLPRRPRLGSAREWGAR